MKIGYPCINTSIGCTANRTFRLRSYSEKLFIEKVSENLECLKKTLEYNKEKNLMFFRIGSGLIPFASHPICNFAWQSHFKKDLREIGSFILKNKMRISMHPDQFVVLNSKNEDIVAKSILEIKYHCELLDLMRLKQDAKVQIHIGGVYGEKEKSLERFIENYKKLSPYIKKRLVIENDDKSFSLQDCLLVNKKTGIPVVFDNLHHKCLNNGEPLTEVVKKASQTWKKGDGVLMLDYSEGVVGDKRCRHAQTINKKKFKKFLEELSDFDFDIMLEIKDKEKSANKVRSFLLPSL